MSRLNPEAQLSFRVAEWLRSEGRTVYAEVPFAWRFIDLVGVDFKTSEIVAVELKMSFTSAVIRSAVRNQRISVESYAAAASTPRSETVRSARWQRIGLLSVNQRGVTLFGWLRRRRNNNHQGTARVLRYCRLATPSDIGGLATIKGKGPARTVHAKILAFLECHPGASWKNIYHRVPNQYAHPKSMQQCMRTLERHGDVSTRIELATGGAA